MKYRSIIVLVVFILKIVSSPVVKFFNSICNIEMLETFSTFLTTTHCATNPESHGRLVQVKVKDQMTIKRKHALPLKPIISRGKENHFSPALKTIFIFNGRFIDFASPLLKTFCDNYKK
jgi:hypothetical protein